MVSLGNRIWPDYGKEFLTVMASVYPGYKSAEGFKLVLMVTGYGLLDGAIGGFLFAVLYNLFAGFKKSG